MATKMLCIYLLTKNLYVVNGYEVGLVRSSLDAVIASGNSMFGSFKRRKIFTSDNEVIFTKEDAKVFLFLLVRSFNFYYHTTACFWCQGKHDKIGGITFWIALLLFHLNPQVLLLLFFFFPDSFPQPSVGGGREWKAGCVKLSCLQG